MDGTAIPAALETEPLAGALGAEVRGPDLARPFGEAEARAIRGALLRHLVVFFRGQDLDPAALVRAASRFGTPAEYPMLPGVPGCPLVTEVLKLEEETVNFGGLWHTDTAYLECPPMGTLLYAVEVPAAGGDTLFSNGYLAFETLSEGMRSMLAGLRAVQRSDGAAVSATRDPRRSAGVPAPAPLEAVHPVVRTHPETGRRALYVNPAHTRRFEGMTEEESRPLLDFLFAHQARPEFTCRFRWRPGSLAFWDNRAALHNPLNDYHGHRRRMLRVQIAGDRPR